MVLVCDDMYKCVYVYVLAYSRLAFNCEYCNTSTLTLNINVICDSQMTFDFLWLLPLWIQI